MCPSMDIHSVCACTCVCLKDCFSLSFLTFKLSNPFITQMGKQTPSLGIWCPQHHPGSHSLSHAESVSAHTVSLVFQCPFLSFSLSPCDLLPTSITSLPVENELFRTPGYPVTLHRSVTGSLPAFLQQPQELSESRDLVAFISGVSGLIKWAA